MNDELQRVIDMMNEQVPPAKALPIEEVKAELDAAEVAAHASLARALAEEATTASNEKTKLVEATNLARLMTERPASPEDDLGKIAWTLRCLTEEVRRKVFHLPTTEQNENARLALRHLEDAQHRLKLAQSSGC